MTDQKLPYFAVRLQFPDDRQLIVDLSSPDSIRALLGRLQTSEECSRASDQLQIRAREHATMSERCFTLGGAMFSRSRAVIHQEAGRFAEANEHVEAYTNDLRGLGVL